MDDKEESKVIYEPSLLSIEDEDKIFSNDKNKNKAVKTIDINNQKLTPKSRNRLLISVILVCLSLIFIPFHSVANSYLLSLEKNRLFNSLGNTFSFETLNSSSLKNLFLFFNLFLNKDFMSGIICVLYTLFHPFVSMKVIYGANIYFYCLILMQILYKSRRPSWDSLETINEKELNKDIIIECESSFSNPCSSLFIFIFFTIYSLFSYKQFYLLPDAHINNVLKIILFAIFMSFLITEHVLLLIYKMHYLYEMIFTSCLTLVLICLLIEFDYKIQNIFFRATKNLFKIRKNKIKFFLYCILQLIFAIILFNFTASRLSSFKIEEKILISDSCSKAQKEEISLSNTFMDISYIFSMLGAFWGASFALEHPPGEWWYHPERFYNSHLNNDKIKEKNQIDTYTILILSLKGIITLLIFFSFWLIFYFIPYISFIFNFVLNCFKYFILFFICSGIMPIIYGKLGLNKDRKEFNRNIDELIDEKIKIHNNSINLFKSSLFVKCFDKTRIPLIAGNKQIIRSFSNKELINPNEEDSFESI